MNTCHLQVFAKTEEVPILRFQDRDGNTSERPLVRAEVDEFATEMEEEYRKIAASLPRLGRLLHDWVDGPTDRWLERVANDPAGLALHIDVEERLRHLPWELLSSSDGYLCGNALRPFTPVRRVTDNRMTVEAANRPLRVLFMASSPEGRSSDTFCSSSACVPGDSAACE